MKKLLTQNGISLLEVLIAMLVLSIGVLGMAPMVVLSIEGNNVATDVQQVSALAKHKLEAFEALDSMPPLPYKEYEPGLLGMYDRTTELIGTASDSTIPAGLYSLRITISWTDKTGNDRTTTYSTYLDE
jgi:prepilin-type N-terminal cleavage/methylation domain-containing protein